MSNHEQCSVDWERAEHAASIAAIPIEQLPDDEARGELIRRALAGRDVYAYTPVGQEEYVVWVRQRRPDIESRFAPMEWARLWREGVQPEGAE
jgi:hypothetical protein